MVIPLDGSLGYMRELMDLLGRNQCISITGELTGKQSVPADFFEWQESYATGAPALAYKMKAALLPCCVVRDGELRYRLVIQAPICVEESSVHGSSIDRHEFTRQAVQEFAKRVEEQVCAHPADWDRWDDPDIQGRLQQPADSGAHRWRKGAA